MADFGIALNKTLDNEGGFKHYTVEGDRGGETYAGISRNAHPDWKGWEYLDTASNVSTEKIENMVQDFYRREFWDKIQGDKIESQCMAESIFDFAVNTGTNTAIKCIQASAGGIRVDGIIGPITIGRINGGGEEHLISKFRLSKIQYYTDIVARNPDQIKFLMGWVRRSLRA